jgi:hypothetical protein
MFLIFEGMDYEYNSIVGCRAAEQAAVERARELAGRLSTGSCWVSVIEYPDGNFDLPFRKDSLRQVVEFRKISGKVRAC